MFDFGLPKLRVPKVFIPKLPTGLEALHHTIHKSRFMCSEGEVMWQYGRCGHRAAREGVVL